ncbi:MAG TPA: cation:proton antiporter [Methanoregulaceae archaeon]|nr:cation:proton antiporter [Methanoregulaceae archaeon]HPD75698.1 cation:proton antiporter [Methanoregulaceae archaeon]
MLIIFLIALVVGIVFNRIRVPPLVAFILTGVIVGPYGISVISSQEQVASLAEIGIILLLFTIGLEFSFKDLWKIRLVAVIGGAIQLGLSFTFFFCFSFLLGLPLNEAILIGFLLSLSSTAIVLKILHEKGEIDSPHGSIALGILIFQDLAAIPMMMSIPFLASLPALDPTPLLDPESMIWLLTEDLVIVIVLVVCAKWVIPRILYEIAKTKNQELFLLMVILVCFGVAWMVSFTGISLAIGALLAGLLISGSEYSHQAVSIILPFRDLMTSFFFISVGMLVDFRILFANVWLIVFLIILVIVVKALLASAAALALGYPLRTATMAGLALSQIGEFSFIIAQSGASAGILAFEINQLFLVVALFTMAITPFVITVGPPLSARLCDMPAFYRLVNGTCPPDDARQEKRQKDHLVIIGYGVTGKNLANAARSTGIAYTIVELNPDLVSGARRSGDRVIFGDATSREVLDHAGIAEARIVVIAINDPIAVRKIVHLIRRLNLAVTIIVRTRYVSEVAVLQEAGADEVIAQEFETSVEIFTRVLHKYLVPGDRIEAYVNGIRADGYRMLRTPAPVYGSLPDLVKQIPSVTVTALTVEPGSLLAGRTLGGVNLRKRNNILVLAIRRGEEMITGLSGESRLEPGDVAIVYGSPDDIAHGSGLFSGPRGHEGTDA